MSRRAVFLDRDGVITRSIVRDGRPYAPARPEELEILPGVSEALERIHRAGLLNIIVTNQPDVAKGTVTRADVGIMHSRLMHELRIDAVKVCFHDDADNCECRKPKPGMLLQASHEYGIDLDKSFMVGDRWRDVAAAQAAGCMAFFIDYGYQERRPAPPYFLVESLGEAAARIIALTDS